MSSLFGQRLFIIYMVLHCFDARGADERVDLYKAAEKSWLLASQIIFWASAP